MKKILGKVKQNLFGFILGGILMLSIGVYAATILASEIKYTNNGQENVQGAIDDLYDKSKTHCPEGKTCISKTDAKGKFPICKRATELHTEICNNKNDEYPSYYCSGAGYNIGDTIKYGNETITNGELHSGDAFDCDVNLDGTYDSKTERFYYVSSYYNTTTKQFDASTAVLIYYNNVSGGIANNTTAYAYDSSNENWHGPVTAIEQLPSTSQWSNVSLKNISRAILNETGGTTTTGGTLPTNFSYSGYAARLLTAQEVNAACSITVGGSLRGELDTCQYLMENTQFSNSSMGTYGYQLETPRSSTSDIVWSVRAYYRYVANSNTSSTGGRGIRPVIEIPISDIEY